MQLSGDLAWARGTTTRALYFTGFLGRSQRSQMLVLRGTKDVLRITEWSLGSKLSSCSPFGFGPQTAYRREGIPASGARTLPTRAYLPQLHSKAQPFPSLTLVSHDHSFADKPLASCLPHAAWV